MSISSPPTLDDVDSKQAAVEGLRAYNGATILRGVYAERIAEQFGVDLGERPGGLEPISNLDRLQPDNDQLGIGVGSLCKRICEGTDDVDAEDFTAGGHGTTQRGLKRENLPLLEGLTDV